MSIKKWPADNVERQPIADLIPYVNNARTHSDEQVAQVTKDRTIAVEAV